MLAFQNLHHLIGVGRNAAHALQEVERGALTGQQRANVCINDTNQLTLLDFVAVSIGCFKMSFLFQNLKYTCKYIQTANNTILLANQLRLAQLRLAHNGVGADVLAGYILAQGVDDGRVHIKHHGRATDHRMLHPFS